MIDFLDLQLYDNDLAKLAFRFVHNVLFLFLVVRFAWHPNSKDRDFAFAAVMLNITVFFICFTMKKLELSLGMGLGLFAIFGVLRYRTSTISTKDLTYLFVVIGVAVINALTNKKTSYLELALVNLSLFIAALIGEWIIIFSSDAGKRSKSDLAASSQKTDTAEKKSLKTLVVYDRIELLSPDASLQLIADLEKRTKLSISRYRINEVDLLNGQAKLSVWHELSLPPQESTNHVT